MRILVEEHKYSAADVKDVLQGLDALENVEGYVSLNYVGYYYNSHIKDCVFILPKVVLEDKVIEDGGKSEELVFGEHRPEDIININEENPLTEKQKLFIYEFSVWVYRAIVVYKNDKKNKTSIVYHNKIAHVGRSPKRISNTFLDILLSLIQFNKENQNFFFFILRNIHSGFNKINWTKTISTSNAIIQDDSPVYLNPVNKKRKINFDEELLIIFFSILNYLGDHYGFPKDINCNFDLIKGKQFDAYLAGLGKRRLIQIKYKYFSDKALELWSLCYAFFDNASHISVNTEQKEYLLVKDFNIVFEAIIDELVGSKDVPAGLKEQEDGKRVDHMYTYDGLTTYEDDKPIYYIGDSKYYKRSNPVGKESVYKQFTYARNVIQWNLNLFMTGAADDIDIQKDKERFRDVGMLRDDLTEGYNIIPNFFISATLNNELSYKEEISITSKKRTSFGNKHFDNRLFDRDTLLVCHYDVNFLYVVSLYARNNASHKSKWRDKVRGIFRTEIQKQIEKNFDFYALKEKPGVDAKDFISTNFKDVIGKLYRPYSDRSIISLALEKNAPAEDNAGVLNLLERYFIVAKLDSMSENPHTKIEASCSIQIPFIPSGQLDDIILVGYLKHPTWTNSLGYYTVRRASESSKRVGEYTPSKTVINVKHVLLYDKKCHAVGLFDLKDEESVPIYTDSKELASKYSLVKKGNSKVEPYFLYELNIGAQSSLHISIDRLNSYLSIIASKIADRRPLFIRLRELLDGDCNVV